MKGGLSFNVIVLHGLNLGVCLFKTERRGERTKLKSWGWGYRGGLSDKCRNVAYEFY